MAYELNFQDQEWGLLVTITGTREQDVLVSHARDAWRIVAEEANKRQAEKILVLSSATGKYPALDAFLINSKLDDYGIERLWKIAFVNLDQESYENVKFSEVVALNRGFNVGVFNDEGEAREWLLASD